MLIRYLELLQKLLSTVTTGDKDIAVLTEALYVTLMIALNTVGALLVFCLLVYLPCKFYKICTSKIECSYPEKRTYMEVKSAVLIFRCVFVFIVLLYTAFCIPIVLYLL